MKRIILFIQLLSICATAIRAASPWDLDSCIAYARANNLTVLSRELAADQMRLQVTEAQDRFLPNIAGSVDQSFSFGRGLTSDNTYANRNTSNFNAGIGLSLPLFQGLAGVRRVDYAKANLSAALLETEAERDNVELNIISSFLQVLYARQVHEVAAEKYRMSRLELDRRCRLLEAGKIAELDVTEAESQVAQDNADMVTTANDARLALLQLARLLRIADPEDFDIDSTLPETLILLPSPETIINNATRSNSSLLASRASVEAADRNLSLARTGWIPTLSFRAGLNTNYYYLSGIINPPFHRQMRDNFSKYLGFSLSVPIFDGFTTRNSVRRARLNRTQAELNYRSQLDEMTYSIRQASLQADNAQRKLESSIAAEQAAAASFAGMEERYNYGKANAIDYETSRSTMIRARLATIQARFELLLRRRILAFYNR